MVLAGHDPFLIRGAFSAFVQNNKDHLTPVEILGSDFQALVTNYNDLGDRRFYDPRSQQSFQFNHFSRLATEFDLWEPDWNSEVWRQALEEPCTFYTQKHYKDGICSVFSSSHNCNITLAACIEAHQYQKFWSGRWCSVWSVTFPPDSSTAVELEGVLKVKVYYCEKKGDLPGYINFESSKEVKVSLPKTTVQQTANDFMKTVEEAETAYQMAIIENYQNIPSSFKSLRPPLPAAYKMATLESFQNMPNVFKCLRRALPATRTKNDWHHLVKYKAFGHQLKQQLHI